MDFSEIFFTELKNKCSEAIKAIENFKSTNDRKYVKDLYRIFHTIKGSASLVNLNNFKQLAHTIESYFKEKLENEKIPETSFLNNLIAVISNISQKNEDLTQEEVENFIKTLKGEKTTDENLIFKSESSFKISELTEFISKILDIENSIIRKDFKNALFEVRNLKKQLISTLDKLVFVKLETILNNMKNLITREAERHGKKIKLELDIQNVKIEKKDSQYILDIILHLVRNSIAHGIESEEERKKLGKDPIGKVWIKSYIKNNKVYIEVGDDGRGIDFEKIKEKIKEKNLNLTPEEAIFSSGFSSKEKADDLSGRGVGLDVVKNFAISRGGDVKFKTEKGKGTRFIVFFNTKNILTKIVVLKDDEKIFAIETSDIKQIINYSEEINGKIPINKKLYEIYYRSKKPKFGVITTSNKCILVDNILGVFDGQFIFEEFNEIKGFVKNVFSTPIPLIDINKLEKKEKSTRKEKKKILLIDDSVITRNIISKFLGKHGFKVLTAKDGIEGIKIFESENIDLVICDLEMSNMDGFEVTKRLKGINEKIPVILFSTRSKDILKKGIEIGADSFISKDEPPTNLIRLIEKFI